MKKFVEKYPAFPYVFPFLLFIVLTGITPYFPQTVLWVYPIKTILVTISIVICWKYFQNWNVRYWPLAIFTGILVWAIWIYDPSWYPHLGKAEAFNPWAKLPHSGAIIWIGFRLAGASLVVAIIEELFWRSFLLRWLVNEDFQKVPLGTFSWQSFIISSLMFGVEHHRWLVGIAAGVTYNLLMYRTKSLFACILAHGVTNFLLGVYVLQTGYWSFW